MVVKYDVFGRKIGSHYLALGTLTLAFVGGYFSMGKSEKTVEQGPPISASSKDEESFIREFLKNAEAEDKKAKH